MKKTTLFLGLGNEILSDDAAGIRLLQEIRPYIQCSDCDFMYASSGGMELIENISGYQKLIIIDAMRTGMHKPGTVLLADIRDFIETSNISSVHDLSFPDALRLAGALDIKIPAQISIIGVEIVEDLVFSTEFSEEIVRAWPSIIKKALEIISGLGIKVSEN